jgi:tRNA-modifying protein YgfZ
MSATQQARLADRAIVSVAGADAEKFLQNLITNDLEGLADGEARYAGLLSPQGKILFDFLAVKRGDVFLLDVARAKAAELAKRLSMYKLRADVAIEDRSNHYRISARWDGGSPVDGTFAYTDPRHPQIGLRLLAENVAETGSDADGNGLVEDDRAYDAHRVRLGVPEGGKDFQYGDAYPHEAGFDVLHGVSFTKGCYVGQEVVARMQNKTIVRKRAIRVSGDASLVAQTDITIGDVVVGRIGTVDGKNAIAMLRLDRAVEAAQKNVPLKAGDAVITPDPDAIERYQASVSAKPSTAFSAS